MTDEPLFILSWWCNSSLDYTICLALVCYHAVHGNRVTECEHKRKGGADRINDRVPMMIAG